MSSSPCSFEQLFQGQPAILAPMEDVTGAVYRRMCRDLGADLCVTEFVNVKSLLRGCRRQAKKIRLEPGDTPTAIQIYGSDPALLAEAADVAAAAEPAFLDINCGCWVPKIARRGAGAGWLRDPEAMVRMAAMVVDAVAPLPVTVKTRIGYGPESDMPIVELARRLEGVGVRALTIHCRTANMGHGGAADWSWAGRAQAVTRMPVIVNGDVKGADSAHRALTETECAGVMVGRRAIEHPWVFREIRAFLDHGRRLPPPTTAERLAMCRRHLRAYVEDRGEKRGVPSTRRHLGGYLRGLPGGDTLRKELFRCPRLQDNLALIDRFEERLVTAA
ncbi:MAG: tRNA-dihydrouridine synthase [Myxococcota bacterium]